MALFGNRQKTSEAETAQPATPAIDTAAMTADITANVIAAIRPLLQQQQPAAIVEDETDEIDPIVDARIRATADAISKPYRDAFNSTVPNLVRQTVVQTLSEGEKIIYERYKADVDAGIANVAKSNPSLAAEETIHRRAIQMVLGAHTREIAQLALDNATTEDLPPTFQYPAGGSINGQSPVEQPTTAEKNQMDYFDASSKSVRRGWKTDDIRHYNGLPRGSVAEMVAAHKAKLKKD